MNLLPEKKYRVPSWNFVKKMFCAKKVTKLPDLTVGHIWFLNFEWLEKLLKDVFYKFLLEFISIVSKNVKPFYLLTKNLSKTHI